jgi:hypothetical protein
MHKALVLVEEEDSKIYRTSSLIRGRQPDLRDAHFRQPRDFGLKVLPPAQAVVQAIPSEELDLRPRMRNPLRPGNTVTMSGLSWLSSGPRRIYSKGDGDGWNHDLSLANIVGMRRVQIYCGEGHYIVSNGRELALGPK